MCERFWTLPESLIGLGHLMPSSRGGRRRTKTPGGWQRFLAFGVTISAALIAVIGKAETFEHARDLAAGWAWFRVNRRRAANRDQTQSRSNKFGFKNKHLILPIGEA
jgi:hypothetical protein